MKIIWRLAEVWLTQALLRSPAFHRGVRVIHKKVHEVQHGKDPAEMGGTKIDLPSGFMQSFVEELKSQAQGTIRKK